ncbi:DapH/DapD/GlmU-related protein [Pararobbsia alpina]|uniref:UDP-3-O-(3-hydroxymyristoyl)glucosamine N-acyltransferase n=1 Tax=Pararobbsia alpina TaxID=621374 RepID=A0A6S7BL84_9BURK|nr:DapH/DapD/GlmU-related protein [Pararobbsia alpina]CAB3804347.1 UDP-3-O-(3-hydroxymyristoyl)glucosamine N-acyltransferase [Pararobbsia alpina]
MARDGDFEQLDEAETGEPNSLVYCQTLQFLEIAERNPNVSVIVTTPALARENVSKALVVVDDPRYAFFSLYTQFHARGIGAHRIEPGIGTGCRIHPSAVVSPHARIGDRVHIGAHAVIESHVEIMDGAMIGPQAVIGAEGLVTIRHADGSLMHIAHAGGVRVGQGVEILSSAVVAKAMFHAPTTIGDHSQIGILTNIGHGARIGARCFVAGNSVVAGRVRIGDDVWIGASVSIAPWMTVGSGAEIKMGSVVVNAVPPGAVVSGNFAIDHKQNMRLLFRNRTS